jgi:hypothetical protein
MANTVRIKRRAQGGAAGAPASLANAELAFNEVDDVLYYGKGTGGGGGSATTVIPIGGPGAFVGLTGAQTVAGVKTFSSSPILPTPAISDNSTAAATTAYVKAQGYITGNQSITVSGDASGTGTTAITLTLANSGVTAGTYNNSATQTQSFTVDAKGRVTSTGALTTITPAWSSITSKPTTISGYGITDAYTKTETDTLLQGLDPKASVRAATTANITLSGTQTIDGVALIAGDRVLVKNQSTTSQNGVYIVAAGSWTRATDMNSWAEVPGAYMFVEEGSTQADFAFVCTSNAGGTLDTTGIDFVQFNGAGGITAGTGIVKSGNTISVSTELAGYHSNATNGIITRTASGTIAARTLSVSGTGISVSNGDGVAGNPTFSLSAALSTVGGLTPAADQLAYYTGAASAALTTLTTFARSLLDDTDASTMRTTLGLGTIATQSSSNINITGGSITGLTTFDNVTIDCGTY